MLVFCAVTAACMVAAVEFKNWMDGAPSRPLLPRMLVAAVAFGALPLVVVAIAHSVGTKRALELTADGASSHKPVLDTPWKTVRQVEIEPIDGRADLARVSVTAALGTKEILKRFSIVLDRSAQLPQLVKALQSQAQSNTFTVVQTDRPLAFERRPVRGLWPAMIGVFFFTIGFPLFAVGILATKSNDRPTRQPPVAFERFVRKHFHSPADVRRAFIIAGSVTTAIGAGFYVWGFRLLNQGGKLNQADLRSRLEQVRVDASCRVLIPQR